LAEHGGNKKCIKKFDGRWECNIRMDIWKIVHEVRKWVELASVHVQWSDCIGDVETSVLLPQCQLLFKAKI